MKRAVIYVRQSTVEQKDSRRVQCDEGSRYAASHGMSVVGVYEDDAVSRSEYVKRPGLLKMLNAAAKKPRPFDVIIIRDVDRLGGDAARNAIIISDLIDRSVELHEYMTGNVVRMVSATDKMVSMLRGFAAEIEREKVSARTRENHLNKARRGLVTGGRIFGYRNIRRDDGVHYEVDEAEAKVVLEIFQRYADGQGLRAIAYDLNDRGVKAPRKHWSPSGIQPMLRRERYNGRLVWGELHKTYRLATKVRVAQEPDVDEKAEHLRIVPRKLWNAVQARIESQAKLAYNFQHGPRPVRLPTMLAGLLECGVCGGRMAAERKVWGTPKPGEPRKGILVYFCQRHRRSGPAACSNSARRPVEIVDTLMAKWVRANIFSDEFVRAQERDLQRQIEARRRSSTVNTKAWERELRKVRGEIGKLSAALLSATSKPDAVVQMIAEREARAHELEARISQTRVSPDVVDAQAREVVARAFERVRTMQKSWPWTPEAGRSFMEGLLDGRLVVTPTADGRFKLAGRMVISRCDPIQLEEGRLVPAAVKRRGLTDALATIAAEELAAQKKNGAHQDHVCSAGRPRRDREGSTHGRATVIACDVGLVA